MSVHDIIMNCAGVSHTTQKQKNGDSNTMEIIKYGEINTALLKQTLEWYNCVNHTNYYLSSLEYIDNDGNDNKFTYFEESTEGHGPAYAIQDYTSIRMFDGITDIELYKLKDFVTVITKCDDEKECTEENVVRFDGPNDERTKCREEARIKFEKILSDMEDKIKREIALARSRGEIYIEQPDIGYWKIHDKDGYYASITTDDWKRIRKCLNEMDRGKSEVFLNEMVYTIMDIMCHECKQKCERCRVNDLLHALYRRLPYQEEGEYY